MKRMVAFIVLALVCLMPAMISSGSDPTTYELDDPIPFDPSVKVGKLENGLRYYIKVNRKPEQRAQLWLAVNAGSVLEDDDQQGLAHFVEHMAFNGTKHFEKQELIDYMESIGMKFGHNVNAYTSFDQTVYRLLVPTDSVHFVEKGFQILEDWAHGISFEPEEIDKERGVIVEEWRLGLGAGKRIRDKQLPILFKGSRYAERLPIGKKEIVETADRETLMRFYRDWYRPDLMAVIAVGDFDEEWIEGLIQKHFAHIEMPEEIRERKEYPVPDHEETLFAIATDPEASRTSVAVCYKSDPLPEKSVADYRRRLVKRLFDVLFNFRMYELTEKADPPFLGSRAGKGSFVRSKDVFRLSASVKEDGIERGLDAVLTEAKRARRFGFTETELERAKARIMRMTEKWYTEREKTRSRMYAGRYASHFLKGSPVPGFEIELALCRQLLPGITLDNVNRLLDRWITEDNRIILLSAPEKEDLPIPTETELMAVFEAVEEKEVTAYVDKVSEGPLIAEAPKAGKVVSEKKIEGPGVTEWELSNGARVVLKPADFDYQNVVVYAFSPGGHSLASDEEYLSASNAGWIIDRSGVGNFSRSDLRKKLAGKSAKVTPFISRYREGFSGGSFATDVELLFELVYLYMTSPRMSEEAFDAYIVMQQGYLENQGADPRVVFQDTISATMSQYHYRKRPLTEEMLGEIDLETAYRIYKERFADASDFTYIIVGYFDIDEIRSLVETYIGSLPSLGQKETCRDLGIRPPRGIIEKTVEKGIEEKSSVKIIFPGSFEWSRENEYVLESMGSALNIKLREVLREDMSGTYGVSASAYALRYPAEQYRIYISFGCSPDRVEELVQTVFTQIDSLQECGLGEDYIAKVQEIQRRRYETNLKQRTFWERELGRCYYYGLDPAVIMEYPELVDALSVRAVQDAAQKYFDKENYLKFVLMPEDGE
jgi:zinc protease